MVATRTIDNALSPQPLLLGFLMLGPRHPYELHQEFESGLGLVWQLGRSHLYAHLKQLAETGLVTVRTEPQPSRPVRNVYSITPVGRKSFLEWMGRPSRHVRHIRLEFLARLYFYRRLGLPGLERLVAEQKAVLQSRIAALEAAASRTADGYWRLVLEFRVSEMKAIVGWLDRCIDAQEV